MGQALTHVRSDAAAGEAFLDAPGARLRVRVQGAGPALALIHGWALDLDMWTSQFEGLRGAHRVIAFDRRGFGLSTGAPSLEQDAADLELVLDTLGVERTVVLGMSQGARVAAAFAMHAPQRAAALILDGAPRLTGLPASELPLAAFADIVRERGMEGFRSIWGSHPLMQLHSSDGATKALLATMLGRYRGVDLVAAPSTTVLTRSDLARVNAPVLLLNGALDSPERLSATDELARCWPQARCMRIEGAGHLPNLDQPNAYNEALRGFLQQRAGNATNQR